MLPRKSLRLVYNWINLPNKLLTRYWFNLQFLYPCIFYSVFCVQRYITWFQKFSKKVLWIGRKNFIKLRIVYQYPCIFLYFNSIFKKPKKLWISLHLLFKINSDLHLQHAWNQCSYCSIRKNVHYVAMGFCLFYEWLLVLCNNTTCFSVSRFRLKERLVSLPTTNRSVLPTVKYYQ